MEYSQTINYLQGLDNKSFANWIIDKGINFNNLEDGLYVDLVIDKHPVTVRIPMDNDDLYDYLSDNHKDDLYEYGNYDSFIDYVMDQKDYDQPTAHWFVTGRLDKIEEYNDLSENERFDIVYETEEAYQENQEGLKELLVDLYSKYEDEIDLYYIADNKDEIIEQLIRLEDELEW